MFDANASSAGSKVQVTFHRSRVQVIAPSINFRLGIDVPPTLPPPPPLRASIQIQGCALALPSGQWYLSFALKRQRILSFVIKTMCWAPWIELHSFQFFLKYSVKGFWNLANFCFWNPKSCKCLLWNSESWALESGIQHKESGMPLMIGIWNPTNDWNPESNTWNPESTVWNPESKTVLDSLMWCKQSPWNHTYMTVLCNAYSSNDLHSTNAVCYH